MWHIGRPPFVGKQSISPGREGEGSVDGGLKAGGSGGRGIWYDVVEDFLGEGAGK